LVTTLRQLILGLLLLGTAGTAGELLLLDHVEGWQQKLPLGALAAGALAAGFALLRPSGLTLRALQWVMTGLILTGLAGFYYHYTGNAEFEVEMRPSIRGFELVWESLTGATPALAPGTMVLFGLLGMLHTFRHPAFSVAQAAVSSDSPKPEGS